MSVNNNCRFIGNLGGDPQMRYTQAGTAQTTASIAVNRSRKDPAGQWVEETEWVRLVAWGDMAERFQQYAKGDKLAVEAEMRSRSYEKEGQTVYITEFHVGAAMKVAGGSGSGGSDGTAQQSGQQAAPRSNAASQGAGVVPGKASVGGSQGPQGPQGPQGREYSGSAKQPAARRQPVVQSVEPDDDDFPI